MAYLRVASAALLVWLALLDAGVCYAAERIALACSGRVRLSECTRRRPANTKKSLMQMRLKASIAKALNPCFGMKPMGQWTGGLGNASRIAQANDRAISAWSVTSTCSLGTLRSCGSPVAGSEINHASVRQRWSQG